MTYKFSDLYEMSSGISSKPEQAGHGSPFLSFSTVFKDHFLPEDLPDLMDISEVEKCKYSILEGDIFLTRTSETLDELGMSSVAVRNYEVASYSGFLKRLRPTQKDITYHKFMAFYLRSDLFRKTMNNNAIMTLRASLNEQIFSYLDLILPPYDEQKKIGDFLYAINKKIELNNKINAELEGMAKLIYDYWFVQFEFPSEASAKDGFPDENKPNSAKASIGKPYKSSGGKMVYNEELKREIPEGWEVKELSEIESNIITGKTPSTKVDENFNGDIPFICIGDVRGNMHITSTELSLTELGASTQKNKFIPNGAICVTCIASPGLVAFATENSQTNQQLNTVVCENKENEYFLYFYLKDYFKFAKAKTGNTFANMNKGDFSSIVVIKPKNEILKKFSTLLKPTIENILSNSIQNQQLSTLRDWLLPMLMNGQVSVKGAYDKMEEVELGVAAEGEGEYK